MRKTKNDKGRLYRIAIIVLLAVFLLSVCFFLIKMWESNRDRFPQADTQNSVLEFGGKEYVRKESLETFLVLGLDKFESDISGDSYNNDKQSDFLLLFIFDHENKTGTTLHINRDTMVDMNVLGVAGQSVGTVNKQIALAHTYGNGREVSCRNAADALSNLLMGVKIDHYLSVTMDAVATFNDLVGGVEVEVLEDFTGIDPTLVKGETITLTGSQALTYVRTRYGLEDSTNSTRMIRQRQYLEALQEKVGKLIESDETFILEAAAKMSEYMISDRTVNQLQELANLYYAYDFSESPEIPGKSQMGEVFIEFYPDRVGLQELVIDLFYQQKND